MKKLLCFIIAITSMHASASVLVDSRRVLGSAEVGDIVKDAQRDKPTVFHTHEAGVYYENTEASSFPNMKYNVQSGSLRANLDRLAKKFGWLMRWTLDIDYDVPLGFTIEGRRMPEIYGELLFHLPIRSTFYSKNKIVVVSPMYDKRETDVGKKYSINPRG